MRVWLDDVRTMPVGFDVWVKNYRDAVQFIQINPVTYISLDHDLGFDERTMKRERTGYDVVCQMERFDIWPVDGVAVHSANPVGRDRMKAVIEPHYQRFDRILIPQTSGMLAKIEGWQWTELK